MNHYERLKVTPDAPPEVIRAAYRALAAKLHPDRQGGTAGPMEQAHEQMVALNNSYLVLMDPAARQAYDASTGSFAETRVEDDRPASFDSTQPDAAPNTRVDVDWNAVLPVAQAPWQHWKPWAVPLALSGAALMCAAAWWAIRASGGFDVDPRLMQNGAPAATAASPDTARLADLVSGVPAPGEPASVPSLSPEQMARMSNEELLAAVPKLLEQTPAPGATPMPAPPPMSTPLPSSVSAEAVPAAEGVTPARVPDTDAAPASPPSPSIHAAAMVPASPLAAAGRHPLDGAGPLALKFGALPAARGGD